jgi:hypothetical protein
VLEDQAGTDLYHGECGGRTPLEKRQGPPDQLAEQPSLSETFESSFAASQIDATGGLTSEARVKLEESIGQAEREVQAQAPRRRTVTGPDGVPRWEFCDGERLDAAVRTRPAAVAASIVEECQALIARSTKPTLPEVEPFIDAYYMLPGNGAGGELHVVLDDGNYARSHIEWCLANAQREETKALASVLLLLSNSQRRRM